MDPKSLIIGAVVGLIAGALVAPLLGGERAMMRPGMMTGRSMSGNVDRHFIEQMIPHHEGAIAMAKVALERSSRLEVRSLASGIIEAQDKEIADMRQWYQEWYGAPVPVTSSGMMGMGGGRSLVHMGGMSGDLTALEGAANFDQEFLRQMIAHHEMAIMMTQMMLSSTERAELKTLADQIITSQNREIQMMRSWLE